MDQMPRANDAVKVAALIGMPLLGTSRRSLRCNNSAASHSAHVIDPVESTLVSRWHSGGKPPAPLRHRARLALTIDVA
jgi:hypothetical protein